MVQQYKHTRTLAKRIKKPLFGKYSKIFHFSPNSKPDVKSKPNPNLYLTKEDPEQKRFSLVKKPKLDLPVGMVIMAMMHKNYVYVILIFSSGRLTDHHNEWNPALDVPQNF